MQQSKCGLNIFLVIIFILFANYQSIYAQDNQNTITFDNKSGDPAMVKLIGSSGQIVEVPNAQSRTINAAAGDYYILVRYGNEPDKYKYSKGDPFNVTRTATQYSTITITLHKVVDGNYPSHPISAEEFEKALAHENSLGIKQTSTSPPKYSLSALARKFGDVFYAAILFSCFCIESLARTFFKSSRVKRHSNGTADFSYRD